MILSLVKNRLTMAIMQKIMMAVIIIIVFVICHVRSHVFILDYIQQE